MMKPSLFLLLASCTALSLVACGDDDETDAATTTTTTTTTATGTGGSSTVTTTTSGGGGMGQGGMGQGGGGQMVNGCTRASAADYTGMATVDVGSESMWDFGHQACIVVDAGTTVTWMGNLNLHPVSGGPSGMQDANSPVTTTNPQGNTLSVTFSNAGEFPYYCIAHPNMMGVIYVE